MIIQNTSTQLTQPIPQPKNVEEAIADFWPEDESVDDFLEFTYQQRRNNLVQDFTGY